MMSGRFLRCFTWGQTYHNNALQSWFEPSRDAGPRIRLNRLLRIQWALDSNILIMYTWLISLAYLPPRNPAGVFSCGCDLQYTRPALRLWRSWTRFSSLLCPVFGSPEALLRYASSLFCPTADWPQLYVCSHFKLD